MWDSLWGLALSQPSRIFIIFLGFSHLATRYGTNLCDFSGCATAAWITFIVLLHLFSSSVLYANGVLFQQMVKTDVKINPFWRRRWKKEWLPLLNAASVLLVSSHFFLDTRPYFEMDQQMAPGPFYLLQKHSVCPHWEHVIPHYGQTVKLTVPTRQCPLKPGRLSSKWEAIV